MHSTDRNIHDSNSHIQSTKTRISISMAYRTHEEPNFGPSSRKRLSRRKDIPLSNELIYKPRFERAFDYDFDPKKDNCEEFSRRSREEDWKNFLVKGYEKAAEPTKEEIEIYLQKPFDQKLKRNQNYFSRRPRSWWMDQHRDIAFNDKINLQEVKGDSLIWWKKYHGAILHKDEMWLRKLSEKSLARWIKHNQNTVDNDELYLKEILRQQESMLYPDPFYSLWMDFFRDTASEGRNIYEELDETQLGKVRFDPTYLEIHAHAIEADLEQRAKTSIAERECFWSSFREELQPEYEEDEIFEWPTILTEEQLAQEDVQLDSSDRRTTSKDIEVLIESKPWDLIPSTRSFPNNHGAEELLEVRRSMLKCLVEAREDIRLKRNKTSTGDVL